MVGVGLGLELAVAVSLEQLLSLEQVSYNPSFQYSAMVASLLHIYLQLIIYQAINTYDIDF